MVMESVSTSHKETGSPTNIITIQSLNEYNLGEACMFFMISASMSAYLMGVNPFNQPGVNGYKELVTKNMQVLK